MVFVAIIRLANNSEKRQKAIIVRFDVDRRRFDIGRRFAYRVSSTK